jgi:4-hydroxy-3-methylbut-2-en-1-yl diphosphate reductase
VLRRRFPAIEAPRQEDICSATTNLRRAVKGGAPEIEFLLVIGTRNSSNSNRLVEVARSNGVAAESIDDAEDPQETWFDGVESVGVTSGVSAPECLVLRVASWFSRRGVEVVQRPTAVSEDVRVRLPVEVR